MITGIFGLPGVGKTALNTHFLVDSYMNEGGIRLQESIDMIGELNRAHRRALTVPPKAPYYATYDVEFLTGYEEYYRPFVFNPFFFGFDNADLSVMHLAPFSQVHIMEAQKYYDSRQSSTFPSWASRAYETHRHFRLDIYYDCQRIDLIDLNIRRITERFYCVLGMENNYRANGALSESIFHCLRFDDYSAVDEYIKTGKGGMSETIRHKGNIFECYNSYDCADQFLPDRGGDFEYVGQGERGKRAAEILSAAEPYYFRHKKKGKKE